MPHSNWRQPKLARTASFGAAAAWITLGASAVYAQDDDQGPSGDYLEGLKVCQQIGDDAERLACFDTAVGNMVTATETGDVQVIDREEVRETRRSLFGFRLPDLGIFGGDDDEAEELFTTTIVSSRRTGRSQMRFTTAEGAVWELNNVSGRLRINEGDTVVFKPATFGYFFVRINGRQGIKGRRVQ